MTGSERENGGENRSNGVLAGSWSIMPGIVRTSIGLPGKFVPIFGRWYYERSEYIRMMFQAPLGKSFAQETLIFVSFIRF